MNKNMTNAYKICGISLFLLLSIMLFGCSAGNKESSQASEKILILFSEEGDEFRDSLVKYATEYASAEGITYEVMYAGASAEAQVEIAKGAKEKGYGAIICQLHEADTALQVERAAKGIPIVFVNNIPNTSRLEADKYVSVGSNEEVAGSYEAEFVLDKLSKNSEINVMIMEGEIGHPGQIGRTNAAKYTLDQSGKKINYVFVDSANWSTEIACDYYKIFYKTNQPLDCVICNNDAMAIGVIQGMREVGVNPKEVLIAGIDATVEGCQAIKDGDMDFSVFQNAKKQAESAIDVALMLAQGKSIKDYELTDENGYEVWIDFEKVDASNVNSYMK